MSQTEDRKTGLIPLRTLKIKGRKSFAAEGVNNQTSCPDLLVGDPTAFAFRLIDCRLGPALPPGTVMYATLVRVPGPGDIAVFTDQDGDAIVAIADRMTDDSFEVLTVDNEVGGQFKAVRDVIPFEGLKSIACVVACARYLH